MGYDFSDIEETGGFEPIKEGQYIGAIESIEFERSKTDKPMLKVTWKITDDEDNIDGIGRQFWTYIVFPITLDGITDPKKLKDARVLAGFAKKSLHTLFTSAGAENDFEGFISNFDEDSLLELADSGDFEGVEAILNISDQKPYKGKVNSGIDSVEPLEQAVVNYDSEEGFIDDPEPEPKSKSAPKPRRKKVAAK